MKGALKKGEKLPPQRRITMAKATAPKTLAAAVASGKYTSRNLRSMFGKALDAANKAGRIAWKRVPRKGMKGFYVATTA